LECRFQTFKIDMFLLDTRSYNVLTLEENEGFYNCKEQLFFGLHWTFATSDNLEDVGCEIQVSRHIVVAKWNGVVSHPATYLELHWWTFLTWLLMWYLPPQLNWWILWLVDDSFATHLQLVGESFATYLWLICNSIATHLGLHCDSHETYLQFIDL